MKPGGAFNLGSARSDKTKGVQVESTVVGYNPFISSRILKLGAPFKPGSSLHLPSRILKLGAPFKPGSSLHLPSRILKLGRLSSRGRACTSQGHATGTSSQF